MLILALSSRAAATTLFCTGFVLVLLSALSTSAVPAPIFDLALAFSVSVSPCPETVETALKFPTLLSPISLFVVPCGLVPLPGCVYTIVSAPLILIFPFVADFSVFVASVLACAACEWSYAVFPLSPR